MLHDLGLEAPEVLLIDNRIDYLLGFQKIGGGVLLVEEGDCAESPVADRGEQLPCVRSIRQLPDFLAGKL